LWRRLQESGIHLKGLDHSAAWTDKGGMRQTKPLIRRTETRIARSSA
jgi:hypothetical protein